jgi:hypothetical protein
MILTRYLYPKNNVEYSLIIALLQENREQAKFWAYELYFSGFKQQVLWGLLLIFEEYFVDSTRKTKISNYLQKKIDEPSRKDSIVATVVENIIRCQINVEKITQHLPDFQWGACSRNNTSPTRLLFVVHQDADIQSYKNRPLISTKSWKLPSKLCKYTCLREPGSPELNIRDYDEWLFQAAGSPLWKSRIQKYYGIVDYEQKTVMFSDEDKEEAFYNLYDLEPDEQSLTVQHKWLGIVD